MDISRVYRTENPESTKKIGKELATILNSDSSLPRIVCLYGELGSGKTTFSQGFAEGLGIKERLLSPTYVYIKEYSIDSIQMLYHIDLYRGEIENIVLEDIFSMSSSFTLIEWADKLGAKKPTPRFDIHFISELLAIHTINIQKVS